MADPELPFDPGTALEILHGATVRIQALRRQIAHTCSLVRVLADEIE